MLGVWNCKGLSTDISVSSRHKFATRLEGGPMLDKTEYGVRFPSLRKNPANDSWRKASSLWLGMSILWQCQTMKEIAQFYKATRNKVIHEEINQLWFQVVASASLYNINSLVREYKLVEDQSKSYCMTSCIWAKWLQDRFLDYWHHSMIRGMCPKHYTYSNGMRKCSHAVSEVLLKKRFVFPTNLQTFMNTLVNVCPIDFRGVWQ